MSQANPVIPEHKSGIEYRTLDNSGKSALMTHHKGSAAPDYAQAGTIWVDDSNAPWKLKFYTGTAWIILGETDATANSFMPYTGTAIQRLVGYADDDGASGSAYSISPIPAIASYDIGQIVTLKPANNSTGACTLSVSGLSPVSVKLLSGANPHANAMKTTGFYWLIYDGANFVLMNPSYSFGTVVSADLINDSTMAAATVSNVPSAASVKSYVLANGGIKSFDTFTGSGTWTKPSSGTLAFVQQWAGGASGGRNTNGQCGGGGGGAYAEAWIPLALLPSTVAVTVGAGGAAVSTSGNGNAGGDTSFGSYLSAKGGGAGGGAAGSATNAAGGGGGGIATAGGNANVGTPGAAGNGGGGAGGAYGSTGAQASYANGGGGGGGGLGAGGPSYSGGGGGGGSSPNATVYAGGTSSQGGAGGAGTANNTGSGIAGSIPGGGGGGAYTTSGSSGAGARGECRVTVF